MAKAAQFEPDAFVGQKPDMAPSLAHLTLNEDLSGSNLSLNKRSIILDEDRFEEQFLRCSICKERFSGISLPRMLPCHHSYCHSCIRHLFEMATEQKPVYHTSYRGLPHSAPPGAVSIGCPSCRASYFATEETIRRLPTDHRVVQLMDFVHHTDHYTVTFCSRHSLQPLNFFCEYCILPVCRDCTVLDHKETEGHLVIDLDEAMAKYRPILDNAITEMEAESICLEEKRIALETITEHIDQLKNGLLEQVKTYMLTMRQLLDQREQVLIAKVHQETEKEKNKLIESSGNLENRRHELINKASKLRQAKEENCVEEMFRIHQEIREYRAEPPLRVREIDDGLMTTFMLNTRDESMLASRIVNFGDVMSKVVTTSFKIKGNEKSVMSRSNIFK